jgi:O-antigen chain-terminating methyltransferase
MDEYKDHLKNKSKMDKLFYEAFENRYRGSFETIKNRLNVYIPFVTPFKNTSTQPTALDLGCGRGEWLELLEQNGFHAKGIDADEGMLLRAKERQLNVEQIDIFSYLNNVPSQSINVISAFHVAEHLSFENLFNLIQESYRILTPGGLLILETPNSENLLVGTSTFYIDPTHNRPLPETLLSFTAEYIGFKRIKPLYLQEQKKLNDIPYVTLRTIFNNVSPDYAIIAQKNASEEFLNSFNSAFEKSYGVRLDELITRYDHIINFNLIYKNNSWLLTYPLRKIKNIYSIYTKLVKIVKNKWSLFRYSLTNRNK